MQTVIRKTLLALVFLCQLWACSGKSSAPATPGDTSKTNPAGGGSDVQYWITRGDQTVLLAQQSTALNFGTAANSLVNIDVDTTQTYQTIDGFGFTLTGGSARVINQLSVTDRAVLLKELFGKDGTSIGISYLRLSMGASDLDPAVFSYDDLPAGQTDPNLQSFDLGPDKTVLIPLLRQILQINPAIKILATPWSAPVWMKDNGSSIGGSLQPAYYPVYAQYFVRYIQQMQAQGIAIDAIAPQNEPLNPANNPSMMMTAAQQADFIANALGPAFKTAGISTKIIVYDHNFDLPDYPLAILGNSAASPYVYGSAFHLYAGDINVLSQVHAAFPDKQLYFTEQYTASTGGFSGDLLWHLRNVIIGATRNWSRTALEWNLANDPAYGPHTPGGCTTCKGALTIGESVVRNVGYFIIAHASGFVPAGSVRIGSTFLDQLPNVAFQTPSGKKVLIAVNDGASAISFNIRFRGKWVSPTLPAGTAATFIW